MDRSQQIELTELSARGSSADRLWQILVAQQWPNTWLLATAVILTLLAFAIRVHNLTLDSFWIDELSTIRVSTGEMDAILNVRDHPPLLYLITRLSLSLFGETEFGVRLPSFLASLPAIPLLIVLGRQFKYPLAGIIAAFLLALSPFHLRHSQEARHYALLMTVSLATYLLLFLAMKEPKLLRWVAYGVATTLNLYVHYGSLVVLAVQAILILGWSIGAFWSRKFRLLLLPATAALTVVLLYVARVPNLRRALDRTYSGGSSVRYYSQVDFADWLTNVNPSLSTDHVVLSPILLAFCLMGIIILLLRRQWSVLVFATTALVVPIILIVSTGTDRDADPRYVIHLLPIFLLLASITLAELIKWLGRYVGTLGGLAFFAGALGLVSLVSLQMVEAEYAYAIHDWRNVANVLDQQAEDGDIIVAMTLVLPNGYNVAGDSLGYFLDRGEKQLNLLNASKLTYEDAKQLFAATPDNAAVWSVVVYWGAAQQFDLSPTLDSWFQGYTRLLRFSATTNESIAETLKVYEQMLPGAKHPFPHCMLQLDMVIMYQLRGDLLRAANLLVEASHECSTAPNPGLEWRLPAITDSLGHQVLVAYEQAKTSGRPEELRETALALRLLQPTNTEAEEYVRFADMLDTFEQGALHLESSAPEPPRRATYNIPPGSDAGDVLLLHPPASAAYDLTLPDEPTLFRSRIGMVPDSWEWGGDGATFVVEIETEDGGSQELFRQHVSNDQGDRYWHQVEVPLAEYAGQRVKLLLKTEPGPAGNEMGDWAIWDRPAVWWDLGDDVLAPVYN